MIGLALSSRSLALAGLALYALLGGAMALRSDGVWLADDITHFQYARDSWRDPRLLLDEWGRPGCTVPLALVARVGSQQAGLMLARFMMLGFMLTSATLAWRVARRLGAPAASIVPLLLLLMPEAFGKSYTPCTEAPAALYAMVGTWLLSRGRRWEAAVVLSLLPTTRHELILLLVPLAAYFLLRRDRWAAILLGSGEVAWNAACSWSGLRLPILRYVTTKPVESYGTGDATHYLVGWVLMAGIVIVLLTLIGSAVILVRAWRSGRLRGWQRPGRLHRRTRVRLAVIGGALGLVAIQTLLYMFNRFASGGYSFFLVPAAPWMAICACHGLTPWIARRRRGVVLRGVLKHVLPVLALLLAVPQWLSSVRPYRLTASERLMQRVIEELVVADPSCHVIGNIAWIPYFRDESSRLREMTPLDAWRRDRAFTVYYLADPFWESDAMLREVLAVWHDGMREYPIEGSHRGLIVLWRRPR